MQQTSHYQLSQWDAEDRIQMADFNSDNQKIEAALTEQAAALEQKADLATVRMENLWCKIAETVLDAETDVMEFLVPEPENFQKLELHLGCEGPTAINLSFNDGTSFYTNGSNSTRSSLTIATANSALTASGSVWLCNGGTRFFGGYETVHRCGRDYCYVSDGGFFGDGVPLSDVHKIVLKGKGNFSAGTYAVLYGLKK